MPSPALWDLDRFFLSGVELPFPSGFPFAGEAMGGDGRSASELRRVGIVVEIGTLGKRVGVEGSRREKRREEERVFCAGNERRRDGERRETKRGCFGREMEGAVISQS